MTKTKTYLYVFNIGGAFSFYNPLGRFFQIKEVPAALGWGTTIGVSATNIIHTRSSTKKNVNDEGITLSVGLTNFQARSFVVGARSEEWRLGIYEVNYEDINDIKWSDCKIIFSGYHTNSSRSGAQYNLGFSPFKTNTIITRQRLTGLCRFAFGDHNCKVNAPVDVTGVLSVDLTNRLARLAVDRPDKWFEAGYLRVSGYNVPIYQSVRVSDTVHNVYLRTIPMNEFGELVIRPGITVECVPGCTKRFNEDCKDKWNNGANFGGFPYIPTVNPAINTPSIN